MWLLLDGRPLQCCFVVWENPGLVLEAVMHSLLRPVIEQKGNEETRVLMENLGPNFSALLASPPA